jgi:FkbM family methyltransferase
MYVPLSDDSRFSLSKSQLRQDLFVLDELELKEQGYFVEFRATNRVDISNTWLLEKEFGWQGILAEPSRYWHKSLIENRTAHIVTDCVWSETGIEMLFNEVNNSLASYGPELSTLDIFSSCDTHSGRRQSGTKYSVKTISLLDLLDKFQAPTTIDYLSIDAEGSEFEILDNFDFDRYTIKIITCEHNYTPMRAKIFDLLTSKGYQRKHQTVSRWDDWYVLS